MDRLIVIGAGLAGCEAAWQAALCGAEVDLYEMRPHRRGPAHQTDRLAELVCSNSLRGAALENAVGLLKEELARLDSVVIAAAREAAVPAGGALAVDRERFADAVESRIANHPQIALRREEVTGIPRDRPVIVACGPLPSDALTAEIDRILRQAQDDRDGFQDDRVGRLHYYDAASPIVAADSIDESVMYRKSRYDKGDGDDYLNLPLDREQYAQLLHDLRTLERHQPKEFEADAVAGVAYFEGCLPVEEMADRGDDVLRFGPLKPVGLRDPRTGKTPYAVVQLRKENVEGTAYNLVGFQTRLSWPAQREAFGKLPGLANAEWLRLGVMHRNTFIDSPRLLDSSLRLRGTNTLYFAGQITGAEGYVEAAACGAMAGIHAALAIRGLPPVTFPRESAFGAVVAHLQNDASPDFQPANVTWAPFPALETQLRDKKERRRQMAERALQAIDAFVASLSTMRRLPESSSLRSA
jgi:methylenetetrahydrofolate--tRNA-(uracil-5-)-methyltransferase